MAVCAMAAAVTGPVHKVPRYPTPLADLAAASTAANAMAAAAQQQAALAGLGMGVGGFNLGLGSPSLGGIPNGLSMAQPAQLNGMNPFNMNMLGIANLSAMGISPEAQLLAAQIAATGGGFGQAGLGLGGELGGFAGMQGGGMSGGPERGDPGRSGGRSPGPAHRASAPMARVAHPPQEETTAAAVRRKTKKISTLY